MISGNDNETIFIWCKITELIPLTHILPIKKCFGCFKIGVRDSSYVWTHRMWHLVRDLQSIPQVN